MLRSIKQLYEDKLGASDGEIGHVKDFYFDEQDWTIRYLVADTGSWLPGRQMLLPPRAFDSYHRYYGSTREVNRISSKESTLFISLTGEAVEQSPANDLALVDAVGWTREHLTL